MRDYSISATVEEMTIENQITIVGCGWLGCALAAKCVALNYTTLGVTHNSNHQQALRQMGALTEQKLTDKQLSATDALVIMLPFKRSLSAPMAYYHDMKGLFQRAKDHHVGHVVWTGSTSIYPQVTGHYTEETVFAPPTERAEVLWKIERELMAVYAKNAFALRVGGLLGQEEIAGAHLCKALPYRHLKMALPSCIKTM